MDNTVSEIGGAYLSRLWVAYCESSQWTGLVGISEEFPLQGVKVVFKVLLERNDVFLLRLALFCLLEGKKKIIVIA